MAFAPDYATTGRFFVYLTSQPAGDVEVREYRRSASDPNRAEPTVRNTLIDVAHPTFLNHNGGQLQVGPDGMLWIGTGDGGGRDDPNGNAQDLGSELGKLLRVTLDGAIPADNPFGTRVWAYGLRNPWRFSFDRANGDLVIGDVGQGAREEIDVARAPGLGKGANWGWPCLEGTRVNTDTTQPCSAPGAVPPFLERSHSAPDDFCSITGGYVVRDPRLPTLAGRYLFGDFCATGIESVALSDARTARPAGLEAPQLSSFGEDTCGRVYVASLAGTVYRIEDAAPVSCTGGTTPPPGGSAGGDTAPPPLDVALEGARKLGGNRAMSVHATCGEACHVRVRARFPGLAKLSVREADVAAGEDVELRPRLTRAEARRVRRARDGRRLLLKVTVHATDAAGNLASEPRRRRLPAR
jgi:hypothetical protein